MEKEVEKIIKKAIKEDLGKGDVTTSAIFKEKFPVKAILISKGDGILCGVDIFKNVFNILSSSFSFNFSFKDGDKIKKKDIVGEIYGPIKELLIGERTALNFLQHLSGIATETRKLVERAKNKVKIYDTRKTIPNLRLLEKYAVKIGGGENHRFGLFDMVLIKDNHIKGVMEKEKVDKISAISICVKRAKNYWKNKIKIEVEVENFKQAISAYQAGADIIMFDNADKNQLLEFNKFLKGKKKVEIEWSGNVSLKKIDKIKKLPVDRVSAGYITHSAKVLDFSLKISSI
ncbi:MAG TPA: carboxylating nicotinate-nucleotide diphosphorylase [bacterium]|nr:carboxylating nicotinate-nucleotide diphosphorylase [bacterium]